MKSIHIAKTTEEANKIVADLRVINLYACISGNRLNGYGVLVADGNRERAVERLKDYENLRR